MLSYVRKRIYEHDSPAAGVAAAEAGAGVGTGVTCMTSWCVTLWVYFFPIFLFSSLATKGPSLSNFIHPAPRARIHSHVCRRPEKIIRFCIWSEVSFLPASTTFHRPEKHVCIVCSRFTESSQHLVCVCVSFCGDCTCNVPTSLLWAL